jgi:hypothetical protein
MDRAGHLPLKIGYFTLEGIVLPGILFFKLIELCAKSAVFHQKDKRRDGSDNQDDGDQKNQQLNPGHWASLGVRAFFVSMLERGENGILQFVS